MEKQRNETKATKVHSFVCSCCVPLRDWFYFLGFVAHSPDLSICGRSLSDNGAGLRRGQGLLDHYAGIVVDHPREGLLVLTLT